MITLRTLRYLVELADQGHFGKAAQACFVSQPTLSAQIMKLEKQLGVQLVERDRKKVRLTDIGVEVVSRARRLLIEADEIVELARAHQDPMSGRLRLGLIPTIGPYLLPHVVPLIKKRYPDLRLMLFEYQTHEQLRHLHAGDIDAAVLALPIDLHGLQSQLLYKEPFFAAVPTGSSLAGASSLSVSSLADQPLLLLEDGHCLRDQALEVCSQVHIQESQEFRATSLETLRQMVAAGAGMTLMPELALRKPASSAGFVSIPFTRPPPHRDVAVVWRDSSARSETIRNIGDIIAAKVQKLLAQD